MPRTARNYVESSLRLINALNVGEAPDNEEANDGLQLFKDMLDAWSTERLILPYTASAEYPTVAGKKVYSVGPGGDWNGARPQKIRNAYLRIGGTLDIPMMQLSLNEYSGVPTKGVASPQPTYYYYEAQYPLGFITLYPVPSIVTGVVIEYDAAFTDMTLDTDLSSLPPGFALAIRYNLAILLAPEYRKSVSAAMVSQAERYKGAIKTANAKSMNAIPDQRAVMPNRGWDWRYG